MAPQDSDFWSFPKPIINICNASLERTKTDGRIAEQAMWFFQKSYEQKKKKKKGQSSIWIRNIQGRIVGSARRRLLRWVVEFWKILNKQTLFLFFLEKKSWLISAFWPTDGAD